MHTIERAGLVGRNAHGGGGGAGAGRTRRRWLSGGSERGTGRHAWATCGECGSAGGEGKWAGPRTQSRAAAKFDLNSNYI
jgi:hypothetical protein